MENTKKFFENFEIATWTSKETSLFYRYMTRPVMSNMGIYDPTQVMNSSELNKCQREGWVKLAFFLISFFIYLYR